MNSKTLFQLIEKETTRQRESLELIASENFVSKNVLAAAGSILTNKYAEGYPGRRYYGGCEYVDLIEEMAISKIKAAFGVKYVNVQPHSGSQANVAVLSACLKPGDKILGFNLTHGGHLTHGSSVNFSGKLYTPSFYGLDKESGLLNYNEIEKIAVKEQPRLIIAGASAYSRDFDFQRLRLIADQVGALLLGDIAHPAGLIVKGLLNNPVPYCHIITTTTHKTLRGPRGGVIMMGEDFENPFGQRTAKGDPKMMSSLLDASVFPGNQGGPLMHIIAAKAIAFEEVLSDGFTTYSIQVQKNAKAMADAFLTRGYNIISGGTDNHLMLIDLRNKNITGKEAEFVLEKAGITINKNMIPFDNKSNFITSGIRVGTAAVTTRGLRENDMETVVDLIDNAIIDSNNCLAISKIREKVKKIMKDRDLFATTN